MGLKNLFKKDEEAIPEADKLVVDGESVEIAAEDEELEVEHPKSAPDDRAEKGPFDESERDTDDRVLDFGAIRIPAREQLGVRLEIDERTKQLVAVALDYAGSTLQVQAFAAPRSSGVWTDLRATLQTQFEGQGGTSSEVETEVGTALRVAIPMMSGQTKGPTHDVLFLGVDGPRWFLRGVVSGAAVDDEETLVKILDLFRSLIVVRGHGPIPPRDLLELIIPEVMAAQMRGMQEQAEQ